ncbi:MAG: 2-octaprenyl-6-methoxyphenyl hydroxylase [Gammaproteobacteria bacterium]|nr:MAG: 2-octaprenyl-6-methoxyphenyl hydroxylase [Gammaproteobacteria bacterium]
MSAVQEFDLLIAGGGMVGASLACALAGLPLRAAVIERVPPASEQQPSFDLRTTALSRSSQRVLEGLGLWAELAPQATPIRRVHVSEQGRFGTAVVDAREQGVEALGYVIENRRLGAAFFRRLERADNVELFIPGSAGEVVTDADGLRLSIETERGPRTLRASLLAIADGARSRLREAVGIPAASRAYEQVAIIGTVAVGRPGDGVAYERFTPQGPLALLPAGGDRYVFVLTRHESEAESVLASSEAAFRDLLQAAFGFRLGRFGRLGQRSAYPLYLTRARRLTAPRCVVVGNAAHGLHPVAGQGYNLGLRDVAVLAELLADALRAGRCDPGDPALLAAYSDWRRRDQRNVVAFTDGLVRLFELPLPGLGALRGLALQAFDLLPGARQLLAREAMGLGGRLPRLVRGLPL